MAFNNAQINGTQGYPPLRFLRKARTVSLVDRADEDGEEFGKEESELQLDALQERELDQLIAEQGDIAILNRLLSFNFLSQQSALKEQEDVTAIIGELEQALTAPELTPSQHAELQEALREEQDVFVPSQARGTNPFNSGDGAPQALLNVAKERFVEQASIEALRETRQELSVTYTGMTGLLVAALDAGDDEASLQQLVEEEDALLDEVHRVDSQVREQTLTSLQTNFSTGPLSQLLSIGKKANEATDDESKA